MPFHVTPRENLESIKVNGLEPRIGERSSDLGEPEPMIYLFPTKQDCDTALGGWLGEEFEDYEEDELVILDVDLTGLQKSFDPEVGYEVAVSEKIAPERILSVLGEDFEVEERLNIRKGVNRHSFPDGSSVQNLFEWIDSDVLDNKFLSTVVSLPVVHFSPYAQEIINDGFTKGLSDLSKLDCIYKEGTLGESASYDSKGFNYAFSAIDRNEEYDCFDYNITQSNDSLMGMYSDTAVLFLANGFYTNKQSEGFNQVIFWGDHARMDAALLLKSEGMSTDFDPEMVDENGNAFEVWSVFDNEGAHFICADDCLSLEEATAFGVDMLIKRGLVPEANCKKAAEVYEVEATELALKFEYQPPSLKISEEFAPA